MKKTNLVNTSGLYLQRRTRIFDLELAYALRYFKGEKLDFTGSLRLIRSTRYVFRGFRYPLFPVDVQILASRLQLLLERITPTQPGTSNLFYYTNKFHEFLLQKRCFFQKLTVLKGRGFRPAIFGKEIASFLIGRRIIRIAADGGRIVP